MRTRGRGWPTATSAHGVSAFGPLSPLEARRLVKEVATHALKRDPDLAEAHTSLAFAAFFHDWDFAGAEIRFRKAIGLNPHYAVAHQWYADQLNAMGRQDEATAEISRAQELEPLSMIIHRDIGWHLFFQSRFDEAVAQLQQTLRSWTGRIRPPERCSPGRSPKESGPGGPQSASPRGSRMSGSRGVNLELRRVCAGEIR